MIAKLRLIVGLWLIGGINTDRVRRVKRMPCGDWVRD